MIGNALERIIRYCSNFFILIIFIDIFISFFIRPDHRIRLILDKIVQPMLAPIRKFIPPIADIDFSPGDNDRTAFAHNRIALGGG